MNFTVQGKPLRGGDVFSATESTPKDALKKALDLVGQGFSNIKIVVDGRAYTTMEFAAAFRAENS
jgi:hypothetical protein